MSAVLHEALDEGDAPVSPLCAWLRGGPADGLPPQFGTGGDVARLALAAAIFEAVAAGARAYSERPAEHLAARKPPRRAPPMPVQPPRALTRFAPVPVQSEHASAAGLGFAGAASCGGADGATSGRDAFARAPVAAQPRGFTAPAFGDDSEFPALGSAEVSAAVPELAGSRAVRGARRRRRLAPTPTQPTHQPSTPLMSPLSGSGSQCGTARRDSAVSVTFGSAQRSFGPASPSNLRDAPPLELLQRKSSAEQMTVTVGRAGLPASTGGREPRDWMGAELRAAQPPPQVLAVQVRPRGARRALEGQLAPEGGGGGDEGGLSSDWPSRHGDAHPGESAAPPGAATTPGARRDGGGASLRVETIAAGAPEAGAGAHARAAGGRELLAERCGGRRGGVQSRGGTAAPETRLGFGTAYPAFAVPVPADGGAGAAPREQEASEEERTLHELGGSTLLSALAALRLSRLASLHSAALCARGLAGSASSLAVLAAALGASGGPVLPLPSAEVSLFPTAMACRAYAATALVGAAQAVCGLPPLLLRSELCARLVSLATGAERAALAVPRGLAERAGVSAALFVSATQLGAGVGGGFEGQQGVVRTAAQPGWAGVVEATAGVKFEKNLRDAVIEALRDHQLGRLSAAAPPAGGTAASSGGALQRVGVGAGVAGGRAAGAAVAMRARALQVILLLF
ncbi:hypothetical protein T492DRAFT_877262 [Pavlovales sp. CCMP2436]|nr:hypothetical protein T492DRAFT_877262 [Pavlovales sp. CCMP2436]